MKKTTLIIIILLLAVLLPVTPVLAEPDPVTVDTSTSVRAVTYSFQRGSFHAEGLFWAFYIDDTNAGWEFSADGTTWSGAFTSIGACAYGHSFSVWFDGTYVHYIRYSDYDLFYRRGDLENDGTITWSAVEQTVYDGSDGDDYKYPSIAVDTNGYVWIGVYNDQPDGDDFPVVLMSDDGDGTWTTDLEYELSALDRSSWRVAVVPLTGGKVYVIYCRDLESPLGQLYNAGWGVEENDLADYDAQDDSGFSAVALGDDVHFVYNRDSTNEIRYNNRSFGVGWMAADVLVQDSMASNTSPALSADPSVSDLYCFWTSTTTDHVYYKQWDVVDGWDAAETDWIDESTDDISNDFLINSFYMDYDGYIGLLYTTKLASPYKVRFDFLDVVSPINIACDSDAEFDRGEDGWVNITVSDPQGVANIDTVDIQVNTTLDYQNFTLRWTQATNTFSELSDPDNICTLNTSRSIRVNIDEITDQICFRFAITGGADGACDVRLTTTDDDANTDTDTYAAEFTYNTYEWDLIWDLINSAFNYFGIPNYMGQAIAYVNGISMHFTSSIANMITLITQQFRIITNIFTWFIRWFTRFTDMILTLAGHITSLFDGTGAVVTYLGNWWTYIDLASWYPLVTLLAVLMWVDSIIKRGKTQGEIQVVTRDLQTIMNILSYFTSMFTQVITTVVDTTFRLFDAIT